MIEVGAGEAQRPISFHPEKAALPELTAAFHTGRIPNDPEDDDVAGISTGVATAPWAALLRGIRITVHDASPHCDASRNCNTPPSPRPAH